MFKFALKKELRYYYPSWSSWLAVIANELIVLSVFWYTAKAFVPNLDFFEGKNQTYFSFIVIGLITIRIPSFFITIFSRKIKDATIEGTLDSLLLLPFSQLRPLFSDGLIASIFEIIKMIITLIIATTIFGLSLSFSQILFFLGLQLIALPTFIGLGLIAAAIFLRFGRGEALLGKLTSLAGILAGAYFPTTVLPHRLEQIINIISPFNLLLKLTRSSICDPIHILIFIVEGTVLIILGSYLFSCSFRYYRTHGTPFYFRS